MRYYIVTGEHSGDIHGADLITEIKKIDHQAHFWSCGGPLMQKAMGAPCMVNATEMAYMGLDFLKKFYKLWKLLEYCKQSLIEYRPNVVILIDYSGFNMRLASFAQHNGFQIYYYIPPKIWAHGAKRIERMKRDIQKVFSTLPFEAAYYREHGFLNTYYVGNPLVKKVSSHIINPLFKKENALDQRPIIALLPGSRIDEVRRILPIITAGAAHFTSYQLIVAGLSHLPKGLYQTFNATNIKVVFDQTYDLLAAAQVGIIASGTASLEAALFNLPQIVVYKTSPLTHFIYKRITTIDCISLVNLLVGKIVVPELIQHELTPQNLRKTLTMVLHETCNQQLSIYHHIRNILGKEEAPLQTAKSIVESIKTHISVNHKKGTDA